MLCLGLKLGEKVQFGEVTIEVRRIRGKQVRILVDAPKAIRVNRIKREVLQARPVTDDVCLV